MKLEDLIGMHSFSGIDFGDEKYKDWSGMEDDRQYVVFIIDGKSILASENPDDGYRSMCNELELTDRDVKNTFPPQRVFCKMKDGGYYNHSVLELYNPDTAQLIMAIGTENYDDYYPCFHFEYLPQNMAANQ